MYVLAASLPKNVKDSIKYSSQPIRRNLMFYCSGALTVFRGKDHARPSSIWPCWIRYCNHRQLRLDACQKPCVTYRIEVLSTSNSFFIFWKLTFIWYTEALLFGYILLFLEIISNFLGMLTQKKRDEKISRSRLINVCWSRKYSRYSLLPYFKMISGQRSNPCFRWLLLLMLKPSAGFIISTILGEAMWPSKYNTLDLPEDLGVRVLSLIVPGTLRGRESPEPWRKLDWAYQPSAEISW